jgi:hypothetical protein
MTETIKLQFVREKGLMPRLIAWWGGGRFSHVDTVLDDGQLLGARNDIRGSPRGVQIRPPGYTDFIVREVMAVPVTVEQKATYLNFLHDQVGKPYDSSALWDSCSTVIGTKRINGFAQNSWQKEPSKPGSFHNSISRCTK